MIEIKNISKTFKNNKVLDGIDLTINQGDVVAIIGTFWNRKIHIFKMCGQTGKTGNRNHND